MCSAFNPRPALFPEHTGPRKRVIRPADAWPAQLGYRPIRDMKAIMIHREFGEVARFSVNPDMWRTP